MQNPAAAAPQSWYSASPLHKKQKTDFLSDYIQAPDNTQYSNGLRAISYKKKTQPREKWSSVCLLTVAKGRGGKPEAMGRDYEWKLRVMAGCGIGHCCSVWEYYPLDDFFPFVFSKHWPMSCVFTGWRTVPTGDYLWWEHASTKTYESWAQGGGWGRK